MTTDRVPITTERKQVLLDDLDEVSRLAAVAGPSPGELRRVAGILRRLLLEQELILCASHYGDRISILANESRSVRRAIESDIGGVKLALAGGGTAFGITYGVVVLGGTTPSSYDPSATANLKCDAFLSQWVAFFSRRFLSRRDVIKYVANKAGGVHYDGARDDQHEATLSRLRSAFSIGLDDDGIVRLRFDAKAFDEAVEFTYEPRCIDPALLEIHITCQILARSPTVQALRGSPVGC